MQVGFTQTQGCKRTGESCRSYVRVRMHAFVWIAVEAIHSLWSLSTHQYFQKMQQETGFPYCRMVYSILSKSERCEISEYMTVLCQKLPYRYEH